MFRIYVKDHDFTLPDDQVFYLLADDGVYLVKNNPLFVSYTKAASLPWLKPQKEGLKWRLPPPPVEMLARVMAFFRAVWEAHQAEAVVLLYYDGATGAFDIEVPNQEVGGGHCDYRMDKAPDKGLHIGTIHSHGALEAFHSERDDADELFHEGLHVTIGTLDTTPSMSVSAVVDGKRYMLDPSKVFPVIPGIDEVDRFARWAEEEVPRKVKPLPRPIEFGA